MDNPQAQAAVGLVLPHCPFCGAKALVTNYGCLANLFAFGFEPRVSVSCAGCAARWTAFCALNFSKVKALRLDRAGGGGAEFLRKRLPVTRWESMISPEWPQTPLSIRVILKQVERSELIGWLDGTDGAVAYTADEVWTATNHTKGSLISSQKVKSYPFKHVRSIDVQVGVTVVLEIGTGSEHSRAVSPSLGGLIKAMLNENMVSFPPKRADEVMEFASKLRRAMKASREGVGGHPGSALSADPLEQIRKLSELHRAGMLSDDEFEKKKAELLARV